MTSQYCAECEQVIVCVVTARFLTIGMAKQERKLVAHIKELAESQTLESHDEHDIDRLEYALVERRIYPKKANGFASRRIKFSEHWNTNEKTNSPSDELHKERSRITTDITRFLSSVAFLRLNWARNSPVPFSLGLSEEGMQIHSVHFHSCVGHGSQIPDPALYVFQATVQR
jgi:hypothetical protein